MASRRARIKGIANIPVRRKTEASSELDIKAEVATSEENNKEQPSLTQENHEQIETKVDNNSFEENSTNNIKTEILSQNSENVAQSESLLSENSSNEIVQPNTETKENRDVNINSEPIKNEPKITRRWNPRPTIKIPSAVRRSKPTINIPPEISSNQNIENEKHVLQEKNTENGILSPPPASENNLTLKSPHIELPVKITEPDRILTSPLSPNKVVNRARIKPTPKLIRRNSVQGSASESEDDARRSHNFNRIRNDSVCSVTSQPAGDAIHSQENVPLTLKDKISFKQKIRRSDQTRKIAEARREFQMKFGTNTPDRKRLTMMDLIYYNPMTNPMSQRTKNKTENSEIVEPSIIENVDDEKEDDPEEENENEDYNPVPQVKVGPNGEIILDEQSLVIEQTGMKKGREQLANSQVVTVDDLDRQYGIYKRPKRSKDWSWTETIKFYRVLNTVGTDFSLMLSLFPGRTRRELKMKFKKEEKVNKQLIDKAIMNPQEFDLSELEIQLQKEEAIIEQEKINRKLGEKEMRKRRRKTRSLLASQMDEEIADDVKPVENKPSIRKAKEKKRKLKDSYSLLKNGLDDILNTSSESEEEILPRKKRNLNEKIRIPLRNTIFPDKENDDAQIIEKDEDTNDLEKENNNNEIDTAKKPVKSESNLNMEKIKDKSLEQIEDTNNNCDSENENEETNSTIKMGQESSEEDENDNNDSENDDKENQQLNTEPTALSTVEPGSLMILSSVGPDGKPIYQVFMVTPSQTKVPVNLSQDVVNCLTTSLGAAETVTLDLPVINDSATEPETIIPDALPT